MEVKLGDYLLVSSPRKPLNSDEKVAYIRMEDVSEDGNIINQNILPLTEIKKGLTYFEKNDVIVAKITPCFENGKGACLDDLKTARGFGSTEFHVLRAKNNSIPRYLFYHTKSEKFRKRLTMEMVGTAGHKRVPITSIINYKLSIFHSKEEQQAIAKALSDVDALINALDALITKKRNIKQGAMQQLLTGKKRLLSFTEIWKIKKLGEIVEIKKGQLITEANSIQGDIPVIAGGKKPSYYHNSPNCLGKTITISASGASAGYVSYFENPIFASDCSTIEENENYSIEFVYYQMQWRQGLIYNMQTGGAQPHVHPIDLFSLLIPFPQKVEQLAIAQILTDMDTEIERLEQQRDKTKNLKQGMMQELLTGKTRLL